MPKEDNKILKYNHEEKSIEVPFFIYADLESFLQKTDICYNNREKLSKVKINKHMPSGYPLFTNFLSDTLKNNLDYYRDKDCMKKFCKSLKEQATKVINYERKDKILSTTKENRLCLKEMICYISKKKFSTDDDNKNNMKKRPVEVLLIIFAICVIKY